MKKYVITGSLGHISKPLAEALIKAGQQVTIITSKQDRVAEIAALGATAAVGSVEDPSFLNRAFAGADAVYLMIPPQYQFTGTFRDYQHRVADAYVAALSSQQIKYAVLLSSIGAQMGKGAGPIDGLAYLEKKLAGISGLNAVFLRPSYFYDNLFTMIPLIKGMNIMGSNFFGERTEKLVLTDTRDIAIAAADALLHLDFKGTVIRHIASDARTTDEIASTLSNAIGKPGIPWVTFSDEQSLNGMLQAGLPPTLAQDYMDMGRGFRSGDIQKDFWAQPPTAWGQTKLEDFATAFAAAFNKN